MARQYGNLGIVYKTRGDPAQAEELYRKSLVIYEELDSKVGMASEYGNLGNIYITLEELEKAEKYHRKSLAINEELGRKEGMATDYGNLGIIYKTRGELGKTRDIWETSKSLFLAMGADHMAEKIQGLIEGLDEPEKTD